MPALTPMHIDEEERRYLVDEIDINAPIGTCRVLFVAASCAVLMYVFKPAHSTCVAL